MARKEPGCIVTQTRANLFLTIPVENKAGAVQTDVEALTHLNGYGDAGEHRAYPGEQEEQGLLLDPCQSCSLVEVKEPEKKAQGRSFLFSSCFSFN